MTRMYCGLILAALAFSLTACKGEQKTAGNAAGGQILPGSVSDAMLPLDTVRSQPPLAPRTEATGKAAKGQPSGKPAASDATAPEPVSSAVTGETPAAAAPDQ